MSCLAGNAYGVGKVLLRATRVSLVPVPTSQALRTFVACSMKFAQTGLGLLREFRATSDERARPEKEAKVSAQAVPTSGF